MAKFNLLNSKLLKQAGWVNGDWIADDDEAGEDDTQVLDTPSARSGFLANSKPLAPSPVQQPVVAPRPKMDPQAVIEQKMMAWVKSQWAWMKQKDGRPPAAPDNEWFSKSVDDPVLKTKGYRMAPSALLGIAADKALSGVNEATKHNFVEQLIQQGRALAISKGHKFDDEPQQDQFYGINPETLKMPHVGAFTKAFGSDVLKALKSDPMVGRIFKSRDLSEDAQDALSRGMVHALGTSSQRQGGKDTGVYNKAYGGTKNHIKFFMQGEGQAFMPPGYEGKSYDDLYKLDFEQGANSIFRRTIQAMVDFSTGTPTPKEQDLVGTIVGQAQQVAASKGLGNSVQEARQVVADVLVNRAVNQIKTDYQNTLRENMKKRHKDDEIDANTGGSTAPTTDSQNAPLKTLEELSPKEREKRLQQQQKQQQPDAQQADPVQQRLLQTEVVPAVQKQLKAAGDAVRSLGKDIAIYIQTLPDSNSLGEGKDMPENFPQVDRYQRMKGKKIGNMKEIAAGFSSYCDQLAEKFVNLSSVTGTRADQLLPVAAEIAKKKGLISSGFKLGPLAPNVRPVVGRPANEPYYKEPSDEGYSRLGNDPEFLKGVESNPEHKKMWDQFNDYQAPNPGSISSDDVMQAININDLTAIPELQKLLERTRSYRVSTENDPSAPGGVRHLDEPQTKQKPHPKYTDPNYVGRTPKQQPNPAYQKKMQEYEAALASYQQEQADKANGVKRRGKPRAMPVPPDMSKIPQYLGGEPAKYSPRNASEMKAEMTEMFPFWAPFLLNPKITAKYPPAIRRIVTDSLPILHGLKNGTDPQYRGKATFLYHAARGELRLAPILVTRKGPKGAERRRVTPEEVISHLADNQHRSYWSRAYDFLYGKWRRMEQQKRELQAFSQRMSKFASVDKSHITALIQKLDREIEAVRGQMFDFARRIYA